jgi:hypothetical protein
MSRGRIGLERCVGRRMDGRRLGKDSKEGDVGGDLVGCLGGPLLASVFKLGFGVVVKKDVGVEGERTEVRLRQKENEEKREMKR